MQGIFVDEKGFVQEGPNMNIGIITQDDVFVTPPFDGCLAGVTMQRLMELIPDVSDHAHARALRSLCSIRKCLLSCRTELLDRHAS